MRKRDRNSAILFLSSILRYSPIPKHISQLHAILFPSLFDWNNVVSLFLFFIFIIFLNFPNIKPHIRFSFSAKSLNLNLCFCGFRREALSFSMSFRRVQLPSNRVHSPETFDYDFVIIGVGFGCHGDALHVVDNVFLNFELMDWDLVTGTNFWF